MSAWPGPSTNRSAGTVRTRRLAVSSISAPAATSGASTSEDGSASTSAPASVARLRIWRPAIVRAAVATPGSGPASSSMTRV